MSKALKIAGAVIGTVASLALIATGVGAPLGTGLLGITWSTIAAGAAILTMAGSLLSPKPSPPSQTRDRLYATLDPQAPRKIALGPTALATDVRYQAYTGADQEFMHWIVCVAAHEVQSIDEIWFDSEMAWSSGAGVASKYSGYLTITPRLVGTSSNGIAIDGVWTSACTLTGCAYFHARFKLTGNSRDAESPFAQSIPTRMTVRGKGGKVPDPRLSTSAGGSGSQSMSDQATWSYATGADSGHSPACQLLFYLLGWRINGKLSVGRGIPAARIDFPSFIAAANMCDEPVTKAAGGTEPRYRSGGVFSEGDDPSTVTGNLLAAMNAVLRDDGGRISIHILHNDLSDPDAISLTADDILGDESWKQTPSIEQTFNIVRGRFVDPSDAALYQLADAPEVELASFDGIDRIDSFDLAVVQSASQWQRLAKQRLQRAQYQGVYAGTFGARAWGAGLGRIVKLSHPTLGWSEKPFRVIGQDIRMNGNVSLVLQEESAAIYAWDAEETAPVTAAVPTSYDPLLSPVLQDLLGIETGATRNVNRGDWAAGTTYRVGDFFVYGGSSYSVLTEHVASAASPPPNANLSLLASQGPGAVLLKLRADRTSVSLDEAGAPSPSSQPINFTAEVQNSAATVVLTVADAAGNNQPAHTAFVSHGTGITYSPARSEDFSHSFWEKGGATVTANAAVAPDGQTTADKLVEGSASENHFLRDQIALGSAGTFSRGVFVKAAGRDYAWFGYYFSGSRYILKVVDLTTGHVVGSYSAGTVPDWALFEVDDARDGWWRIRSRYQPGAGNTDLKLLFGAAIDAGNPLTPYLGDGTSGIYVWGAHKVDNPGADLLPYVPTVDAPIIAVLPDAEMTASAFNSLRGSTEGITVTAHLTDGFPRTDKAPILRVQKGDTGEQGPAVVVTPDKAGFTHVDGALSPASQTATFTATLHNISGTINWTTSPNIKTGTGASFTISTAELGANPQVMVTATVGTVSQTVPLAKLADNAADVTATKQIVVQPPAPITVQADSGGTLPAGTFNKDGGLVQVAKGGVSIRTGNNVSYVAVFTNGTGSIDSTNGSADKGRVTWTGMSSGYDVAYCDVTVTVDGISQPVVRQELRKQKATATIGSPPVGGTGDGPLQNSDTIDVAITSTSNVVIAGPFTVRAGSGGKINAVVDCAEFHITGGTSAGSVALTAGIYYRAEGVGSFVLAGTERSSTASRSGGAGSEVFPGSLSFSELIASLTAGNDYEIELVGRVSDARGVAPSGEINGTAQ